MKLIKALVLVAVAFTWSQGAFAKLSIKERKKLKTWEGYIKGDSSWIPKMNEKCGSKIAFSIDKSMVKPFMAENRSAGSICGDFASALKSMCEYDSDDIVKPEIKKISKVHCTFAKGKNKLDMKLDKGTLTVGWSPDASNTSKRFKDWLENNL